jgi:O-antigen chain-terminating methyltransferase
MDSSSGAVFRMNDGFYRALEERYRGCRELIKLRLKVYLPFVQPLLSVYPAVAALDLGCGRGEWVELLVETGFTPMGVDADMGMLDSCLKLALPVEHGDALDYLCALPSESQAVISAIHLVEHITFDQLRMLIGESFRVLKPGGLLIMETPNPENILVATRNFYLDPTHLRPIPSMLLAFAAEYAGFVRVKTLRLQESKDIINRSEISLQDIINGASPDYSIVAQKSASESILALTGNPFAIDYGLSLEDLIARWDSRFVGFATKAQQAESKAQQAESKAQQALALVEYSAAKVDRLFSLPITFYRSTLGRFVMLVRRGFECMLGLR